MTDATWPAALPQALLLGLTETAPNLTIRTQMEAGPAKVRQRFTAAPRPVQGELVLTESQANTLDTFYVTTLAGGALRFGWRHPRTDAAVTYRFTEPPSYQQIGALQYRVAMKLEILP